MSVSILTRAFARVQPYFQAADRPMPRAKFQSSLELLPECNKRQRMRPVPSSRFQSSLELLPECNALILACVQDGAQEAVCANPPKKASDAGWGKVEGKRVFNVP